jgi:hypothetical protein
MAKMSPSGAHGSEAANSWAAEWRELHAEDARLPTEAEMHRERNRTA